MSLALRLSLTSLLLTVVSFSSLSSIPEELGGLVGKLVHYAGISSAQWLENELAFYGGLRALEANNVGLSAEITRLRGEVAQLREVSKENEYLRRQLGLELSVGGGGINLAQVVGLVSDQGGSAMVLDKGEADNVEEGDLVIFDGHLIGEIRRVERGRSLVTLLGDPRLSVAALDQNSPARARGVVSGSFGTKLRMEKILPEEQIDEGDLIISSGLDGRIPRGLVLGQVTRVIFSVGEILKGAELRLLFDPGKLEEVFIRKP